MLLFRWIYYHLRLLYRVDWMNHMCARLICVRLILIQKLLAVLSVNGIFEEVYLRLLVLIKNVILGM